MKRALSLLVVSLWSFPSLAQDAGAEVPVAGEGTDWAAAPAPPEPEQIATPPDVQEAAPAETAQPSSWGQWVWTAQYGWVFMPYSSTYTYVNPAVVYPYMYVYGPTFGWTWVVAPWLVGWGPWPFFGVFGPRHFFWWGHGVLHRPWRGPFVNRSPGIRPNPPAVRAGRGFGAGPAVRPQAPGVRPGTSFTGPRTFRPQAPATGGGHGGFRGGSGGRPRPAAPR